LRQLAHRAAQCVGIHPQGFEPAAQLEEAGHFILQCERLLEHAAQLIDLAAQLLCILGVLRELGLGAPLCLRDVLGLFVKRREHRDEPLQRFDARLQFAHDLLRFGERLHERRQILAGIARGSGEGFEGHAFALHFGEDRPQFGGKLLGGRLATEDIPGHRPDPSEEKDGTLAAAVRGGWAVPSGDDVSAGRQM